MNAPCGAETLVANLRAQGVKRVFGVPGAKIDRVFDALLDSGIDTVVCRHEQNAAFIAQGIGRMTGQAGVCLVTSGPGCTNLVTAFATATSEGAPVVGFGGAVPRADRLKQAHQSLDTASLFRPVAKYSVEVESPDAIAEVTANAFRAAEGGRPGAAFVSLPLDVQTAPSEPCVLCPVAPPALGPGDASAIAAAARLINEAKRPVLLVGMMAGRPAAAAAIRALVKTTPLPTISTFQGAGVLPRDMIALFGGRVGLFHNQPADRLLDAADVVVALGHDPIEYDASLWNRGKRRAIVHVDCVPCDIDKNYRPTVEITGDIAASVTALAAALRPSTAYENDPLLASVRAELEEWRARGAALGGSPIHPLRVLAELRPFLGDDVTLALDMGSFHIWHARYLYSFQPQKMLVSNGQQTLGVALPWAIAACLARPNDKVLSVSGDGGFLFSAMELETAVRLGCNFVHMIWRDGAYDMVKFQEVMKYGRSSGVEFGPIDTVKFAEAFGARGYAVTKAEEIGPTLRQAMDGSGPALIDIPVDYRHNIELGQHVLPSAIV